MAVCVAAVALWRGRRAIVGLGLTALLVAGLALMIRIGNLSGLFLPLPRVLLSAVVPVMALIAGAWAGLLGPRAPLILGIVLALAAAVLQATQGR